MKKINCNIIKDVLPLYLDDVVSNDTKEMVEEHLNSCDACRKEAIALKQELVLPVNESIHASEARIVKKLRFHFFKSKVLASIISVLVALAVVSGIYNYLISKTICVPYNSQAISIYEEDGKIYASYHADKLYGTVCHVTPILDGEEETGKYIAAFYYYETPWLKYIQPQLDRHSMPEENIMCIGDASEIEQVFYGEFDVESSQERNYDFIVNELWLVWER